MRGMGGLHAAAGGESAVGEPTIRFPGKQPPGGEKGWLDVKI